MCGIAGIFNYRTGEPVDATALARMVAHMHSRGPDGSGTWCSTERSVGLGHRRLSIIDLSNAASQPMLSAPGDTVIVFNGEIYNFAALRAQLTQEGRRFRSSSDTEVLLQLYERYGEAMLQRLRGMFAFAIWDGKKRSLFLARDPFGIKPLYYSDDGKSFRFASQVKTLLAGGGVNTSPEPAGHAGFFIWGHIPEPYTLYKGIRALPAGHTLTVGQTGPGSLKQFYSIPAILRDAEQSRTQELPPAERNACLRNALVDTVQHHLIADVPVGVFLSSGIDSTTLAALAVEQGAKLRTVTLGFEEFRGTANDEVPLAEEVARVLGAEHQTIWVTGKDFADERERLFEAMDQPSIDGVNTYFVSLAARRAGLKVAISGLGGDELFAGYPSFREIPRLCHILRPFARFSGLGCAIRFAIAPVALRLTSPKYASILEYGGSYAGAYLLRRALHMPWELDRIIGSELAKAGCNELRTLPLLAETTAGLESPPVRVSALETSWYMRNQLLRDSDWASMAHSLEIRVPLLDKMLLQCISPILAGPNPPTKDDLASMTVKPLPPQVLSRPKTGFVTPVRNWLENQACPPAGRSSDRGLRGWAKHIFSKFQAL